MPYFAKATPDELKPTSWYSLRILAEVFDCQPATLRRAIGEEKLKAQRRGRVWIVRGEDALDWWATN